MLDLNYVRSNLDRVRAGLEARGFPAAPLDDFASLDAERRRVIAESDALNAQRNASSREIGALMKEGKKEEAEARRREVGELKERIAGLDRRREEAERLMQDLLSTIPNVPHESVPVGADESANREVRQWGDAPRFDFEPRDHVELGTDLGILDLERAAKIASARFAILKGAGARLERALINFMLDVHTRDTRGVIRQHQFDKVELVKLSLPENSYDELEGLTRDAEEILQKLGLHYRVVTLSTGDLGASSAKTYDIEVWLPSQNTFREISSCSNFEDYQARRAQIRFRRAGGAKPEYVHTLNGSGLAVGRTWLAILENYQQPDGSVVIPEALRPYMGGLARIEGRRQGQEAGAGGSRQ